MRYRPEIDGLRAIAVFSVILFHAGSDLFGGGFVGVDVFFVISGYLITGILLEDFEKSRFSIADFYEKRARRILPALFLVMLCCLPFAWAWMTPAQMQEFAHSVIAVPFFVSNVLFWSEGGYFGTVAEEKPLLHTWSLAVEEQYYIFFPILLLVLMRKSREHVFGIVFAIAAVSFLLSVTVSRSDEMASFFLAPTRVWEILAGSLIAIGLRRRVPAPSDICAVAGLVAIFCAILLFDRSTRFPGFSALLPVVGTVLVIVFASGESFVAKILGSRTLVGLGLISYSGYLWHQPLFAFARIRLQNDPGILIFLGLSALSFLLAAISWRYVETPFRERSRFPGRQIAYWSAVGAFSLAVAGFAGHLTDGFSAARFTEREQLIAASETDRSSDFGMLGDAAVSPDWILIGDSHANSLQEALDGMFKARRQAASVKTINGCPPAMALWRHDQNYGARCDSYYQGVLDDIEKGSFDAVIISARYALYLSSERFDNREGGRETGVSDRVLFDHIDFRDTVRPDHLRRQAIEDQLVDFVTKITVAGTKVYVLSGIPEVGWDVPKKALWNSVRDTEVRTLRAVYDDRSRLTQGFFDRISHLPGVKIVSVENALCDRAFCYATEAGVPMYFDTNHLSRSGARRVVSYFQSVLEK